MGGEVLRVTRPRPVTKGTALSAFGSGSGMATATALAALNENSSERD